MADISPGAGPFDQEDDGLPDTISFDVEPLNIDEVCASPEPAARKKKAFFLSGSPKAGVEQLSNTEPRNRKH
jgi:hypothetical protein